MPLRGGYGIFMRRYHSSRRRKRATLMLAKVPRFYFEKFRAEIFRVPFQFSTVEKLTVTGSIILFSRVPYFIRAKRDGRHSHAPSSAPSSGQFHFEENP